MMHRLVQKHCRLNAIISGDVHGGELYHREKGRTFFRVMLIYLGQICHMHSVSPVGSKPRYVWSFGVLK